METIRMESSDGAMIAIFQQLSSDVADLYALVLTAAGIDHRIVKSWAGWAIAVWPADAARAAAAIEAYRQENPETIARERVAAPPILRQASW